MTHEADLFADIGRMSDQIIIDRLTEAMEKIDSFVGQTVEITDMIEAVRNYNSWLRLCYGDQLDKYSCYEGHMLINGKGQISVAFGNEVNTEPGGEYDT